MQFYHGAHRASVMHFGLWPRQTQAEASYSVSNAASSARDGVLVSWRTRLGMPR